MSSGLTATIVKTKDVDLRHDEQAMARNQLTLENHLGPQKMKLTAPLRIVGGTPGQIHLQYNRGQDTWVDIEIATCGTDDFYGDRTGIESTDHVKRVSDGGNAYNETEHLRALEAEGLLQSGKLDVFEHPATRLMLHIRTERGTYVLGEGYPEDLSFFRCWRQRIAEGCGNITDHTLADLFDDDLASGPVYLLNPTSSKRKECGVVSATKGRSPTLSLGISEISEFLGGAAIVGKSPGALRRIIHPSVLVEHRAVNYFTDGVLHPAVQESVDLYGWQYSQLLYHSVGRDASWVCDLVLTAGPCGGAARMRGVWAFSSAPQGAGRDSLANSVRREQQGAKKVSRTDFDNIQSTAGCGDAVAAIQAYVNCESRSIRDRLSRFCWRANVRDPHKLDLAELIHASLVMRIYGLLVFHSDSTNLSHLSGRFLDIAVHTEAIEEAARLAADVNVADLHPRKPVVIRATRLGVDIALWRQWDDREWPKTTRWELWGINKDPDEVESPRNRQAAPEGLVGDGDWGDDDREEQ